MSNLLEYIKSEKSKLDRSIVQTPNSREDLFNFGGVEDTLLIQMAIQYGYTIAIENMEEEINKGV